MYSSWGPWMMGYFGWGGVLLGLFTLGLLTVAIVFSIRYLSGQREATDLEETALEILQKRYAKGEVTKEEFERIRRDLQD